MCGWTADGETEIISLGSFGSPHGSCVGAIKQNPPRSAEADLNETVCLFNPLADDHVRRPQEIC